MPLYNLWGHTDLDIEIPEDLFPDEAYRDKKDTLLGNPEHGFFESCHEGKKLHYRKNLPPKGEPVRAIVVWQHGIHSQSGFGMQCASGRYLDMPMRVRMMNAKGYAVYAHDQLGHGFSEGERFYIPDGKWQVNRDDLVAFARLAASELPEGTPLILSGDSYGGCLAFHAAHVFQTEDAPSGFLGCALNCPAFEGDLPPWPIEYFLRYGLRPLFPRWTPFFMPHPITCDRIWKEEEPRTHYSDQSLSCGLSRGGVAFCLGTAEGLVSAIRGSQALFPGFRVPFHINHGSDDYGVPVSGSQTLFDQSQTPTSDKVLNIVDGGLHGLFAEESAEETMAHEIKWIEKMVTASIERGD
mmetsp:Transcript_15730/g.32308  ORF Transcript_15730/g.32308 Transcript_15730/m.32308 type:complete len:353 (+) Transcript_15730:121-1179(+)|eukprot:CAMPEP_0201129394 /NCGR_PEP_ID=MMETSP0850-20130426/36805_1 /ASSEMBLY_ACC=CAM_ASM_000622 /TAXON_ID=183588 /ORGANISM="Pseudo-nitzschia fraudulenta, Strain WWA7" /LENGTH=352 /DNA_ID=CAMNT_0047398857 /DNA_START=93 /DNA_END=1151 /DNA_ORIENTATION=-